MSAALGATAAPPASAGATLSFHEVMSGPFAMGVTDPGHGARIGRRTGWRCALHGHVTIEDVDRFVADPSHAAILRGEVELPGVARRLPLSEGRFNLFAPSGTPGLTLLLYQAALEHGGQRLLLAGRKDVRDDLGLDLWRDTTTLHVRLHREDDGGPVLGAGILEIGVPGLLRLLASMRASASSPMKAAQALASFGVLFATNLRDAYLLRPRAYRRAHGSGRPAGSSAPAPVGSGLLP